MATFGGDGVTGLKGAQIRNIQFYGSGYERLHQATVSAQWRKKAGIPGNSANFSAPRCVLCGGVMLPEDKLTAEHTVPQWLHKLTGTAKSDAPFFGNDVEHKPTWEQLALDSHSECNRLFGARLEDRARSPFKKILDGQSLHVEEIEIILDFLDKIRTTVNHTASAFAGYPDRPSHNLGNFAEARVGAADRIAIFLRVKNAPSKLMIIDPFCSGYSYTPSAVALLAGDIFMISVSATSILSPAFGLQYVKRGANDTFDLEPGTQMRDKGFGWRLPRITAGLTIAQPMRRQEEKIFKPQINPSLKPGGDGRLFQLSSELWHRKSNIDFGNLPEIEFPLGMGLVLLEVYEWLIIIKELDNLRYPAGSRTFMNSMDELLDFKFWILERLPSISRGLVRPYSDRPAIRSPNLPSFWV